MQTSKPVMTMAQLETRAEEMAATSDTGQTSYQIFAKLLKGNPKAYEEYKQDRFATAGR